MEMGQIERSATGGQDAPQASAAEQAQQWVSPGVSVRKRWLTGVGVLIASVVFFGIALWEGAGMLVSTLIGVVFIGGFVGYLTVVAPTPFIIKLSAEGISRAERGGEPEVIPWDRVAKIKEEVFPNGKPVSIAVFKRVGEKGLHRSWVVYGDDIPRFPEFIAALHASLPAEAPWIRDTVHE